MRPRTALCKLDSLTTRSRRRRWEQYILQTLASRPDKKSDFVILRSGQLVGTALIVLCKTEIAGEMRNVEAAIKKVRPPSALQPSSELTAPFQTGVRGLAGNSASSSNPAVTSPFD